MEVSDSERMKNLEARSAQAKILDLPIFVSLGEVRKYAEMFIKEHNEDRAHKSLGDMTPIEFAA